MSCRRLLACPSGDHGFVSVWKHIRHIDMGSRVDPIYTGYQEKSWKVNAAGGKEDSIHQVLIGRYNNDIPKSTDADKQ